MSAGRKPECELAHPATFDIPPGAQDPFSVVNAGPGGRRYIFSGITTRAYFAARAPHSVPEWFMPKMSWGCPVVPSHHNVPPGALRDELVLVFEADHDPESCEAIQWVAKRNEAEAEQARWQAEFRQQTIAQWPWAWADMVLKAGQA